MRSDAAGARPYRVAFVLPLPIHYYAPLMRRVAASPDIDLTVLYCSDTGVRETHCLEMGRSYRVDMPLLEGYRSRFVRNVAPRPTAFRFWGLINPGLVPILRAEKFDAVMVMGWGHASMFIALAAAKLSGTPVLMHGDSASLYPAPLWKRWLRDLRLRVVFSAVDAYLVCGTLNREFYLEYGASPDRMFFTPWAVDNDFFMTASDNARAHRDEERRRLAIDRRATVFLFVGKLVPRKRPLDALRAVRTLVEERRHVVLLFAGDGPERVRLERYAADHDLTRAVRFLGYVPQSDMPRVYAMSDVFVLPSEKDPRGTVTNEAMACGLPIVISDRVGVWGDGDIVRHGENGFVYPCARVDLLTDSLREMCAGPERRIRMGRRSREIISAWNHDVFVEGLRDALRFVRRREERVGLRYGHPAATA